MMRKNAQEAMKRLELDYCPVAVKFCYNKPAGYEFFDTDKKLCQHFKIVQETGKTYYIDIANEGCFGKFVLGAAPLDPFAETGAIGFHHGIFHQASCNAKLYYDIELFKPDTIHFVLMGPATEVDFDPDLIVFVAPPEKADIIMRALSYYTGDLYESRSTTVLGCHWLFNYPFMSGKANFLITGIHFGMKRERVYPSGLHIISVPFQKFQAFFNALEDMEWELPALCDDEEMQEMVRKYYEKFEKAHDKDFLVDPSDRGRND